MTKSQCIQSALQYLLEHRAARLAAQAQPVEGGAPQAAQPVEGGASQEAA